MVGFWDQQQQKSPTTTITTSTRRPRTSRTTTLFGYDSSEINLDKAHSRNEDPYYCKNQQFLEL